MERQTVQQLTEYKGFGGSYYDSISHASLFRDYKPYDFGVKTSQLFSTSLKGELVNKKFTHMTMAKGNFFELPGGVDDYEWSVGEDANIDFRITEVFYSGSDQPGKDGQPFFIALDREWLHEPAMLLSEDPDAPLLRIIGYPVKLSANSFKYEVELQTGNSNDWMDLDLIQPGRSFTRNGNAVADEDNKKYGPDQFGGATKLRSWTGQFANKVELSNKFLRMEIAAAKSGRSNSMSYSQGGKSYKDAVTSGYLYQASLKKTGSNEKINKGVFITKAEARLLERTEMDREYMMEFGRLQKTEDRDTSRTIKIAPGWRQLVRDGHFWEHNGSMTLADLSDFLTNIFFRRKSFMDRNVYIYTGEGGIEFLSRLIAEEASLFNYPNADLFVRPSTSPQGFHSNELEYGSQFTKIKLFNGVTVTICYDPMKDDDSVFKTKVPGTNRPVESFAMDILDFGTSEYKAEGAGDANITMVKQAGVEEYFTVSNVYDFNSGAETSGRNVYALNTDAGIYRTLAGSLAIWDVSRVGRIEYNPYL
jgi:hypothetical protein